MPVFYCPKQVWRYQIDSITDTQIAEIEAFCAEVREGLDNATFEDKLRYFELFDVRGKLAIEVEGPRKIARFLTPEME